MVLPFKRAEAEITASYTIYGKLPNRADFVRINASHGVVVEFDGLIQRTLERLASEDNWTRAYDASRPVEFQYLSRDARYVLMGMLAPSADQAGRRYPLLAAAILPSESIAPHVHIAPIAYEVFFDGLREQVNTAINNSVEALSCRQFLEAHQQTSRSAIADLELANSVVERFMTTTSIRVLCDLLSNDSRMLELEQTLLNLAFYRAFLRRFDNPLTNQLVLLPLPIEKGEQVLVTSAWLSVLKALALGRQDRSIWCVNYLLLEALPKRAELIVGFTRATDKQTTIMLGGNPDTALFLDLKNEQEAWKNHRLYAEVSYALGRLIADPSLSLASLCDFLQEVGHKLEEAI